PSPSGRLGLGLDRFLVQAADLVGQLGAIADPVVDARDVQHDALLVAGGNRVVVTDALDVAAVAGAARVGDDDVVERALLGAAAGETDLDQGVFLWPSRQEGEESCQSWRIGPARKPSPSAPPRDRPAGRPARPPPRPLSPPVEPCHGHSSYGSTRK